MSIINPNDCLPTGGFTEEIGVVTAEGYVKYLTEIKVGEDRVMGADGQPVKVVGWYHNPIPGKVYKIVLEHSQPLFVEESHKLILTDRTYLKRVKITPTEWIKAKRVQKESWGLYKRACLEFADSFADLPIDPYVMGYEYYGQIPGSAPISYSTLPSLHPYKTSTLKNRLQFLAGIVDAQGIRTAIGYRLDLWYPELVTAIVQTCWSSGITAEWEKSRTGFYHIAITETSMTIPSRKYQTRYNWDEIESLMPKVHSWNRITRIECIDEEATFYGLCTEGNKSYLTEDYICANPCEYVLAKHQH